MIAKNLVGAQFRLAQLIRIAHKRMNEWKQLFLEFYGLDRPDGRELYKYRVEDRLFESLESMLSNVFQENYPRLSASWFIARSVFPDLFVLYCAEWWRRRYDGKGFRWEPILADLGIPSDFWSPLQRSECVEKGLNGWGLRVSRTGGHTYIGSVAAQGGLPTKVLAEARGGIGRLIGKVLSLAKTSSVSIPEISGWVESLDFLLPKSYRQPAIIALLTDITWTVLDLKEKAQLTPEGDTLAKLDEKVPGWRDRFPLTIDDSNARALIEQLVKDAARIRPESQTLVFPVWRIIEKGSEDEWQLRSGIELPTSVSGEALSKLFEIPLDDLPRSAELLLVAGQHSRQTHLRRIVGGTPQYRIARSIWEFSELASTEEHLLRLNSQDGQSWFASAQKGYSLDDQLPWLFSEELQKYKFIRQGSGNVPTNKGIVAIPIGWQIIESTEPDSIELLGEIGIPERELRSFSGSLLLQDSEGHTFRFNTGSAADVEETFEWKGKRLWLDILNPSIAFRGKPELYIIADDGTQRKTDDVKFTGIGLSGTYDAIGPMHSRHPTNGDLKHRSRMLILPATSSERFDPIDARSGRIALEGWRCNRVTTSTPHVTIRTSTIDASFLVELGLEESTRTPDFVDLDIHWPNSTTPARLKIPFPAKGVRAFDGNGRELPSWSHIPVQSLFGTRIVILGVGSNAKTTLRLSATDKKITRKFDLRSIDQELSTEVRISDYRNVIDYLHTIDDNPDSTVTLSIEIDGSKRFELILLPYAVRLERDEFKFWLDVEKDVNETNFEILALPLERPGEEPEHLECSERGSDGKLFWNFYPEQRDAGAWLIYAPKDSATQFRPMLWTIPREGSDEEGSDFKLAISIEDRNERAQALDHFIEAIASNFDHPGWAEVNQLARLIGHLPLSTLDIWRRFARSSKGMAALAFRYNEFSGDFLSRFSNELPLAWETIAFVDWKNAIDSSHRQIVNLYGTDTGTTIFSNFVKSRVSDLTAESGSLFFLLGIIQGGFFEDEGQQLHLVRNILGPSAAQRLFVGENSPLMDLRRNHNEEIWPTEFSDMFKEVRTDPLIKSYLAPERYGMQDSVINLPIILAVQAAVGNVEKWFTNTTLISQLDDYQTFDIDWFEEAFNQTIARCLSDGLLDRE